MNAMELDRKVECKSITLESGKLESL